MATNEVPNRYDLYSRICLAAFVLATTGAICHNIYCLVAAVIMVTASCIAAINNRGRN